VNDASLRRRFESKLRQFENDDARYNWFTEGFTAADLKNAKALLEEVGA
jgi:hypothetical protein